MNWTVYSKTTGEILEHRVWPRGEPLHLSDNIAATPGHIDETKFKIRNGIPVKVDAYSIDVHGAT